jgi:uncharacterized Zn finger protein
MTGERNYRQNSIGYARRVAQMLLNERAPSSYEAAATESPG